MTFLVRVGMLGGVGRRMTGGMLGVHMTAALLE